MSTSNKTRRYSRFCGIDVGKTRHVACIIDRDGNRIAAKQTFANSADGFEQLSRRLREAGGPRRVLVGMEATGHYWYALHDHVQQLGYRPVVLNPLQTAQQAKKAIRNSKTDRIDAGHIAVLLKNGEYRPTVVPGELAMTCRQLTRLWYELRRQQARLKQLIGARLESSWPEYESYFTDPLCATGRRLLRMASVPQDLAAVPIDELATIIRKTSRGKLDAPVAQRISESAAASVGTKRGLDAVRIGVPLLIEQLEAMEPFRQQLERQIEPFAQGLPGCVFTLPGANTIRAASLFGETDPITSFERPEQLIAFAGLDPAVYQTGQYEAPRRRISKRGSPYLRHTLWTMAYVAAQKRGEMRDYYLQKRRNGMHHLAAVTAVATKLTRIAWRILTDQRDYVPRATPCRS